MTNVLKINRTLSTSFANKGPKGQRVAFSGASMLKQIARDEVFKQSKFLKQFEYFNNKKGEIMSIAVNAIGTGLIAPFFIAFNPLSEEDKETKAYSALRQPISAVLAVLTQVGVNMQFNKYINKLASKGENGGLGKKYDLSAEPDKKYLYAEIKKNNKQLTKEQIWEKVTEAQNKIKDDAINKIRVELESKGKDVEKASRVLEKNLAKAKKRLGGFKAASGIALSLVMMPITCSALNWLYPRMIEVLFPSLCDEKEGDDD